MCWHREGRCVYFNALMVPAEGLEPPTPTLGRWRSIL